MISPTFNERVIREALLNAVSHRNYQLYGSVFVRQYEDRLVVESPGGFPPGITLENILYRQAPRNRRISEILAKCGLVERSGQGMNLIYELSIQEAKALPDFEGTDSNQVRITLNGLVLDKNILLLINKIGEETYSLFSTEEFLIINYLAHNQKIPSELQKQTRRLLDLGLIEKIGRNNYILARQFYEVLGKPGLHTRRRGLDRDENKELILKHLKQSPQGTKMAILQQVLPSKTRSQIQVFLRELRRDGKVYNIGKTSSTLWFYKETDDQDRE